MKQWTPEQRESAIWLAGRIATTLSVPVDTAIELACQRNELLAAVKEFLMLLAPANTAWGKQVQEWQDKALAAVAKAEGR